MWDKIKLVYGGYDNERRDEVESLRGKYYDMRMKEGENVAQIKVIGGKIVEYEIVSKVLRILFLVYAIKVSDTRSKSHA